MADHDEERDLDAAERALGVAPRGPENAADAAARQAWESRLAPLSKDTPSADPPADMLHRIEALIDSDAGAAVRALRRQARTWRAVAGAAIAVAAALLLYIAIPAEPGGARYVAVVTADDGGGAGLIIEFDTASGLATVIPTGMTPPAGQSYEMWQPPKGADKPFSLGLLPQNPVLRREISAGPGDLFAISLEPLGGSPTGQPTQPLYHGRIILVKE